jgi:hypothetical protein
MIIIDAIGFLIPTTLLAYGLNAGLPGFARGHPLYAMFFKTDCGIDLTNHGLLCRMEKRSDHRVLVSSFCDEEIKLTRIVSKS